MSKEFESFFKTVGEDEPEAYAYWNGSLNPNPEDCCNLRRKL